MYALPALMRAFPQVTPWNLGDFTDTERLLMLRQIGWEVT